MSARIVCMLAVIVSTATFAQDNFSFYPEKPKPGDLVTIVYEPGSDLKAVLEIPAAIAYENGSKTIATDLALRRSYQKLTATLKTDTSTNFVYFSFSVDKKFDNNRNKGYWIELFEADKPRKGSNLNKALFYQYMGRNAGVEKNTKLALASYEKEFELYPEERKNNLENYVLCYKAENKDAAAELIQREIETILKDSLKTEIDYALVEKLYNAAKLPQQANLLASLKKEKYPNGQWTITETINKYYRESDPAKKKDQFTNISAKIASDSAWKYLESDLPWFRQSLAYTYIRQKKWTAVEKLLEEPAFTDKNRMASLYNSIAWEMQQDSSADWKLAEKLSKKSLDLTSAERIAPDSLKPSYLSLKQWRQGATSEYATYADTYAMIHYRLGQYKKGIAYAKEAALQIEKGRSADANNTYALLAEKVMSGKKLQPQLEKFVIEGKSTATIKEILKRVYVKEKKSDEGYDDYITALEKESYLKMIEALKKSMLKDAAPEFTLYNLDGNQTSISELKGKTVVVDFWATWCGPCVSSFPGMKKALEKYKDDPNVKFVFINTWESAEDKKKNVKDFLEKNDYPFDVYLDMDDTVVAQFKVDGIPTKFIIDKEGTIRFKSVGFGGNDDKLLEELSAMIDLAANPEKKSF